MRGVYPRQGRAGQGRAGQATNWPALCFPHGPFNYLQIKDPGAQGLDPFCKLSAPLQPPLHLTCLPTSRSSSVTFLRRPTLFAPFRHSLGFSKIKTPFPERDVSGAELGLISLHLFRPRCLPRIVRNEKIIQDNQELTRFSSVSSSIFFVSNYLKDYDVATA